MYFSKNGMGAFTGNMQFYGIFLSEWEIGGSGRVY
jgi:hypothetical protein